MDKKIILLGYSGHSYSVIDAAHSCGQKIGGYCDLENNETNPFNLKYFGPESKLDNEAFNTDFTLFPSVGDGILRKKLISFIEKNKFVKGRRKQNEISFRLDLVMRSIDQYELRVFDHKSLTEEAFQTIEETNDVLPKYHKEFTTNFWEEF